MNENNGVREVVVYIHGVAKNGDQPHVNRYRRFNKAVRRQNDGWPHVFCGVEWGSDFNGAKGAHRLLTDAQGVLGVPAFGAIRKSKDRTWKPVRLLLRSIRELIFYGFGDIFCYVPAEGKQRRGEFLKFSLSIGTGRVAAHET